MSHKSIYSFALSILLACSTSQLLAQNCDYGCQGGFNNAGSYTDTPGIGSGLFGSNCGRGITVQQAAASWSSYCSDDCGLHRRGCGLFQGCGGGHSGGCGSSAVCYDDGFNTNVGFAGHGTNLGACGGGCRLFGKMRGLFSNRGGFGGGCGCFQGCFGYPNGNNYGCGAGNGCGSHFGGGCGGGLFGGRLGCGGGCFGNFSRNLFGKVRSLGHCSSHHGCGLLGGLRGFAGGLKSRFGGCGLFHGCFHRIGRTGIQGGHYFDAPHTTSHSFGFYSEGSGAGCCGSVGDLATPVDAGVMTSAPVAQPHTILNHSNVNGCLQHNDHCHQGYLGDVPPAAVQPMHTMPPADNTIPGEVVGEIGN